MGRKLMLAVLVVMLIFAAGCTKEVQEAFDDNNDIVVRNYTSDTLWIKVDGFERGHVNDDGLAKVVWDDIADGTHLIAAYNSSDYTDLYCTVTTGWLENGEDFFWYLEDNGDFSGTKEGDCH